MSYKAKISGNSVLIYKKGQHIVTKGGWGIDAARVFIERDFVVCVKTNGIVKVSKIRGTYGGTFGSLESARRWIEQQTQKKTSGTKSKSGSSKQDTLEIIIARIVFIVAITILLALSPGILIHDILSEMPRNLGEKWLSVSLISAAILVASVLPNRKKIERGLIIYGAICAVSAVALLAWWYFYSGTPLSGTTGKWF